MKIIQTPPRFYPYRGGTEWLCFYLSRGLVKKGHQVKVVCADEPIAGDSHIEGIEVRRLSYIGKIANTNITLSLPKELLTEQFDIIHTHLPHPWSADISAWVSLKKKRPLFLSYHNDITGRGFNKFISGAYNFLALRFLLKQAEKIFILHKNYMETSPFLQSFMKKIIVNPPGVDPERFRALDLPGRSVQKTVFFLSVLDRFHRYKGLEYLLLAVKKLVHRFPLKLYIGGSGELLPYYRRFVSENGLGKEVVFLGFVKDEELLRYYNLCDVFVLPSISAAQEGFGMVALEAMACGIPVIVSDIVGVADDVRKENAGIVLKGRDVDALSEALEFIFSSPGKAREMGESGLKLAKTKYSWENHTDIVDSEYRKFTG